MSARVQSIQQVPPNEQMRDRAHGNAMSGFDTKAIMASVAIFDGIRGLQADLRISAFWTRRLQARGRNVIRSGTLHVMVFCILTVTPALFGGGLKIRGFPGLQPEGVR